MSHPRLAWIGLGNMGRGMVKNLVEKAQYTGPITIYNRTRSRSEKLASTLPSTQIQIASSIPEAVASADIIFTCLSNDSAVEQTLTLAFSSPSAPRKLFVECSTIHPDLTDALSLRAQAIGAEFVACPVFGAPAMAESGQLICVPAGPASQVLRVKPFCKNVMGRAEIDFSDRSPGSATRLKVIGNTFVFAMVEALAVGHVLAEKSGLGAENLHRFIEEMFPGPYTAYSGRMLSGDYFEREEPAFQAELARKDTGHARELGEKCGVELRQMEVADGHLRMVVEHAGDKGDIAGIYGAVRMDAGLKYENK